MPPRNVFQFSVYAFVKESTEFRSSKHPAAQKLRAGSTDDQVGAVGQDDAETIAAFGVDLSDSVAANDGGAMDTDEMIRIEPRFVRITGIVPVEHAVLVRKGTRRSNLDVQLTGPIVGFADAGELQNFLHLTGRTAAGA